MFRLPFLANVFLFLLSLPIIVSPTAVYFGAAVAHRSEHERGYHRRLGDSSSGSWRPSRAAALRNMHHKQQHGTLDSHEAMMSASRTLPQSEEEQRHERSPRSAIPLRILLELANTKNLTQFVSKHVRTHSATQRKDLQTWAAAMSTPQVGGRSTLLASTRRQTGSNAHRQSSGTFESLSLPAEAADDMTLMTNDLIAEPGGCEPMLQIVKIPLTLNHTTIMYPSCVKVYRCSDCCPGESSMVCKPTRTSTVEAEVQLFSYTGSHHEIDHLRSERVVLVAHEQCQCECRVRASDCTDRQTYNSESCECQCNSEFESEAGCHAPLVWNANECRCACPTSGDGRLSHSCPPGTHFDNTELCKCVPN